MTYSHAQHIIAAFCFISAMMVWQIGSRMIYYGQADLWFVAFITGLFAASGISFDLDSVVGVSK